MHMTHETMHTFSRMHGSRNEVSLAKFRFVIYQTKLISGKMGFQHGVIVHCEARGSSERYAFVHWHTLDASDLTIHGSIMLIPMSKTRLLRVKSFYPNVLENSMKINSNILPASDTNAYGSLHEINQVTHLICARLQLNLKQIKCVWRSGTSFCINSLFFQRSIVNFYIFASSFIHICT